MRWDQRGTGGAIAVALIGVGLIGLGHTIAGGWPWGHH